MLSTLAFIFVLSVLVLMHEFGHFMFAKLFKVRVEIFSLGFGKKVFAYKQKDTEYRLSLIPLGGYVKLAGENPEERLTGENWEYLSKPIVQRAAIVFAGPFLNYIVAFLLFCFVFIQGVPVLTNRVGNVLTDYPAAKVGLQKGDYILSIDGEKVNYWEDIASLIHDKVHNKPVKLEIERGDKIISLEVVPQVEVRRNIIGQDINVGLIGIEPSDEVKIINYGFFEAIYMAGENIFRMTKLTYLALSKIIIGRMSLRESVTGPIGIFYITGEAAKLGWVYLLQIMAALSISLAIINLLPLPVLDGGHLLFLGLEKLKGKPVNLKIQELATRISISLLVALMLFVFYNDLIRFGIFEKIISLFTQR